MKFENLMLQSLFAACLLVCVLVMGAMLTSHVAVSSVAESRPSLAAAAD